MKNIFYIILSFLAFPSLLYAQQTVIPGSNADGSFYNFNINGETQSISASTSSSSITFSLASAINSPDVTITNSGAATAFIGCGVGTVTAQLPGAGNTQSFPILTGETMTLRKGVGSNTCSAITGSGSATVYFTAGQGN